MVSLRTCPGSIADDGSHDQDGVNEGTGVDEGRLVVAVPVCRCPRRIGSLPVEGV
ncbi:MAG: hypothetical protein IVW55_13565 [Chloroflexi bacterium]|nr:hypothetical protein [Chloroflexota bacterium]